MNRALASEKEDWNKHTQPEESESGYYYTQLPSILYGMVEDQASRRPTALVARRRRWCSTLEARRWKLDADDDALALD